MCEKVNQVPVVAWYRGAWYMVQKYLVFQNSRKSLHFFLPKGTQLVIAILIICYYSKSIHKHGIVSTPINTIFKSFSQNANRVQILILLKSLIKAVI